MYSQQRLQQPAGLVNTVTATEMIDGVRCLLVLEQDMNGCYQEKAIHPLEVDALAGEAWQALPWTLEPAGNC